MPKSHGPTSTPSPAPHLPHTPSQQARSLGTVAVTHVLAYLEAVTGRGPQDARLQTLACSLDPHGEGPQATVDLDTFLVVMRDWIATCQLNGWVPTPPSPRKPFLRSNLLPTTAASTLWAQGPAVVGRRLRNRGK